MDPASAIATADDIESVTSEPEPIATWEHEDLAQVDYGGRGWGSWVTV